MVRSRLLFGAASLVLFTSWPAAAAEPDPATLQVPAAIDRKAKELVLALAHTSYADREQASRELKELGRFALPALQNALATCTNAEVQLRCELLLPRALAEDFKARVDCFLADAKGQYDHKLPGAKAFFAIAGQSEASRTLFRDIVLSPNQALLFALGGPPEELAKALILRRNQFRSYYASDDGTGRPNPKPVDIAAILFAETTFSETLSPRQGTLSTQFLQIPEFRATLDAPATKAVYTAILIKWMETREIPATIYSAMTISTSLKLPTAMTCAKKLLANKTGPAVYKGYAMTTIAREGKPDDLGHLEALMKDSSVLTTTIQAVGGQVGNRRITIQVRDAALALALLMQKKDPVEFGLVSRVKGGSEISRMQYSYHYFDDTDMDADKKRDASFKKYDEWKAEQAKKK